MLSEEQVRHYYFDINKNGSYLIRKISQRNCVPLGLMADKMMPVCPF